MIGTPNQPGICPICGSSEHLGDKLKELYDRSVCKKCHSGFMNRRIGAFIIDLNIWIWVLLPLFGVIGQFDEISGGTLNNLDLLTYLIFVFKDGFKGQSPGKKLMGVQVVDKTTGQPIGFLASFKRNLPLLIPLAVFFIWAELREGKRLGDGWANTRVIWEKYRDKAPFVLVPVD